MRMEGREPDRSFFFPGWLREGWVKIHGCQPSGLSPGAGGICVLGTFKQIQVDLIPVQLQHGGVRCIWAGRKWAEGARFPGRWICCPAFRRPGAGEMLSLKGRQLSHCPPLHLSLPGRQDDTSQGPQDLRKGSCINANLSESTYGRIPTKPTLTSQLAGYPTSAALGPWKAPSPVMANL